MVDKVVDEHHSISYTARVDEKDPKKVNVLAVTSEDGNPIKTEVESTHSSDFDANNRIRQLKEAARTEAMTPAGDKKAADKDKSAAARR